MSAPLLQKFFISTGVLLNPTYLWSAEKHYKRTIEVMHGVRREFVQLFDQVTGNIR